MAIEEMGLEKQVEHFRAALEEGGAELKNFLEHIKANHFPATENEDRGEVIANITLAYRHIEDARMRLGKVYQARNGGVSNSTR